ncbi:MAG: hypothetical protein FJ020_03295 [Chloroflexi bacterium]|nr:hypothetical protein [Chloroflexota bacterium]
MTKYIFLIHSPEAVDRAAFKSRLFDTLVPRLLALDPQKLKLDLTEPKLPRFAVMPLKRTGLAMISIWDGWDDRAHQWQSEVAGLDWKVFGYQVAESTPVAYRKDWKDGEASPGMVMLTIMKRNARLHHKQFMDEWFGHHTPMAVRIHPLWNYIRNVVESAVVEGSPAFDGIVEEHVRARRDVTNPVRYFGGLLHFIPNMIRVGLHANKFLDLSVIENYLLTEYHIRS